VLKGLLLSTESSRCEINKGLGSTLGSLRNSEFAVMRDRSHKQERAHANVSIEIAPRRMSGQKFSLHYPKVAHHGLVA